MIKMNLQLFGGRGSGSRMSSSGSNGNSISSLNARRDELFKQMDDAYYHNRVGQYNDQWLRANAGIDKLNEQVLDSATDDDFDKSAEKFFSSDFSTSMKAKLLKTLAGTKKDGSPTTAALRNAEDYGTGEFYLTEVVRTVSGATRGIMPTKQTREKFKDKAAQALIRYAKKQMGK